MFLTSIHWPARKKHPRSDRLAVKQDKNIKNTEREQRSRMRKHQLKAQSELQQIKRDYALERHTFL